MKVVLTADGSRTLYSEAAGENFHSGSGAWSEACGVYLENSGVRNRLQSGWPTSILEIGLGSGLNFLATADVALQHRTSLHYLGIDQRPVSASDFQELGIEALVEHAELVAFWLQHLQAMGSAGTGRQQLGELCLSAVYAAAESTLADPHQIADESCDVVYHDAFSPQTSPELWTESFLRDLHRVLKPHGVLTTYCVKSQIRRRLQAVGFQVRCLAGPAGGKRQVLRAVKPALVN